ncbi:MAG TPA: ABC transporter permease [Candidatus Binataceae bacterium]|jgi:ABC-2 type transport system permease protein|nr:ABC transporter permease [Candidatus Binataceae bacterium]
MMAAIVDTGTQIFGVDDAELRKLRHDPTELLSRAIQPALWLLLFGQVMAHVRGLSSGTTRYLDFMAPGILAQSVLFVAIFYGISSIWERDLGIVHRYLASPAPRAALVLGKALSAGVRSLSQAVVVYALALVLGIHLSFAPLHVAAVILFISLGAALFCMFSLIMACLVRTRERFMGIGQALTMPIFFASNAIYPISLMPTWLQTISRLNPLTYEVDGLRAFMLSNGTSKIGVSLDFAVLIMVLMVLLTIAARLYPRMGQ